MKLSNFLNDVGRVVAYHPKLKKVTGSTTSTIFICQLLYWQDKTKDGWIYKTSEEIEEETGLTYNEQRTARASLVALKLISEERKRLDHTTAYKVNQKELNKQWEALHPRPVEEEQEEEVVPEVPTVAPVQTEKRSDVKKQGDLVDAMIFYMQSPAMEKEKAMDVIREKISLNLHVNPDNKKWVQFIEYAYKREKSHGEPFDKFIEYAIKEGFNPLYWTPEKMITLYPQAYIKTSQEQRDFVADLPVKKTEDEAVFMPRELKDKKL